MRSLSVSDHRWCFAPVHARGILNYVSGQYSISRIDVLRITLVASGYPLFVNGKIAGGIGVRGGSEEEHRTIAEHVIAVFDQLNKESLG